MKNYGVLKGVAQELARDDDSDPHSEVLVVGSQSKNRIAVNVRSSRGPESTRLIEYVVLGSVRHPLLDYARTLPEGFTDLRGEQQSKRGVDYIRSNLFRAMEMKPIVHTSPGPDNDLFEKIEALLNRAIKSRATVYAYGEKWGPEAGKSDQYFRFLPGNGIHLIHMNQGDSENPNAKYQDGALFVEFPSGETAGLFLKFQNQAWHTDEDTADPLPDAPNNPPIQPPDEGDIQPWDVVPPGSPYRLARIVGALVNPRGQEVGRETVTIFNTSPEPLTLDGWKVLDVHDRADNLRGTLGVAQALTVALTGTGAQLGNKGGPSRFSMPEA
jgi:uncharacterized protein YukJ